MDAPVKEVYLVVMVASVALAKTLRYQIVTRGDGQKEIHSQHGESEISPDLRFLAQDLNLSFDNTQQQPEADHTTDPPTSEEPEKDAHQLMNKWNTYTANGWTGQKNQVYANSTKLIIYDDHPNTSKETLPKTKQGRSENITAEPDLSVEVAIDQPGVWEVIERLYDCFQDGSKDGSTVECLKRRITNFFLKFVDQSLASTTGKSTEKTLVHGKKVLKGALLPLLVLLIIKYLVTLPVIAAGLITIKTFWLSLLSAGVAAFGAPWKQGNIIKRYRPEADQGWSHQHQHQPPAWTTAIYPGNEIAKIGTATDKYYM